MAMTGKRRHQRFQISLNFGTGEDYTFLGQSRDISESGVFVRTDLRPAVGSTIQVGFGWGDEHVMSPARVIHHGEDGIGLEFLERDWLFERAMQEIIEEVKES